jgi:hypothetical protein
MFSKYENKQSKYFFKKINDNPDGNFKLQTTRTAGGGYWKLKIDGLTKSNNNGDVVTLPDVLRLRLLKLTTTEVCTESRN